jgi:hypothetical protein
MQDRLQALPCPVCGTATDLLDVVDFNKTCHELHGQFFALSGIPIYYTGCDVCGFVFAPEIWAWEPEAFADLIYNEEYALLDPDYAEVRPDRSAQNVLNLFPKMSGVHLDYGGGNGRMSERLREAGWRSQSWDPFLDGPDTRPEGAFDLVTAFEVFEHVTSVERLMQDLDALTHESSVVLFSTQVSDGRLRRGERLSWWYAAPRNGHISLYSRESLKQLGARYGFNFGSFDDNYHLYCRNAAPPWAWHLINLA